MLNNFKKWTLVFAVLAFAHQASALTFAESAHDRNKSSIYGHLGFFGGEIALGADYETQMAKSHSAGGTFRYVNGTNSVIHLGGFIRVHFFKRAWDFYVTPGFGLTNGNSQTLLGPSMAMGIKYQFNKSMAAGLENATYYYWLGDKAAITALGNGLNLLTATLQFGI